MISTCSSLEKKKQQQQQNMSVVFLQFLQTLLLLEAYNVACLLSGFWCLCVPGIGLACRDL